MWKKRTATRTQDWELGGWGLEVRGYERGRSRESGLRFGIKR